MLITCDNLFIVYNLHVKPFYPLILGIHKEQRTLQMQSNMLERQHLLPQMESDLVQHTLPLLSQMVRLLLQIYKINHFIGCCNMNALHYSLVGIVHQ